MRATRQTAVRGMLPLISVLLLVPLGVGACVVILGGRPYHQDIVLRVLSGGQPVGGIPVRILIDQGATCEGEAHDLAADSDGVAQVSHMARLGIVAVRVQSVAVCLPHDGEWVLAWSSRHGPAPARLSVLCDTANPVSPKCDAEFEN